MSAISERRHSQYLFLASLLWLVLAAGGVIVSRLHVSGIPGLEGLRKLEICMALSPLPGILHAICLVHSLKVRLSRKTKLTFVLLAGLCCVLASWTALSLFASIIIVARVKFFGLFAIAFVAGFLGAYAYFRLIKKFLLPGLPSKKAIPTSLLASSCALCAFGPPAIAITLIPIVWWLAFSVGLVVACHGKRPATSVKKRWRRVKVGA